MEGLLRTDYCEGLSDTDIGSKSTVTGWVQRTRDMGGVIFLDLRDKTGILQVVFDLKDIGEELFSEAEALRNEYVVKVTGEIRKRDEETYNPNIPTGTIELKATELEILSKSKTLPFPVEDYTNVKEELRLKYRYLDLRRPHLLGNLSLRHKTAKAIRQYLDKNEFLEVETPILTKSTPEGARDYLVPSRVEQGKFYALPQSPQIFKQLLMVSGIDRYYQIARCFRDEDLRADRQPEFTQVDLEMSFVSQEGILNYLEGLFKHIFSEVMEIEINDSFPRMTYQQAMDLYGSDKPDIRFGMEIVDLSHIAKRCNFKVFRSVIDNGGAVRALNIKGGNSFSRNEIDELTDKAISYGAKGMAWIAIEPNGNLRTLLTKFLTDSEVKEIIETCQSEPGDLIIFCADELPVVYKTLGNLRLEIGDRLDLRKKDDYKFLIVTDFPLLEWSEEENRYIAMHHPFTMPADIDKFMKKEDLSNMNAMSYDFVLNGIELGSGSIRIHRSDIQQRMFEVLGFNDEDIKDRFGFMIEAFSYGTPPHGGFAFGLDRLVMLMAKADSIRDVIAFPKMRDASCPLTQAPSDVAKEQLDILGISVSGNEVLERKAVESNESILSKIDIDALSEQSQILIDKNEIDNIEKELLDLIKSTSMLNNIDPSGVEPIVNIHPINNVTRSDTVEKSLEIEEVLFNAPSKEDSYILVPKINE
ncbi:MAG: aspartate--tRNA ligase [Tissierellaceae bacterium]|nr:aspartate--tRNA ligase [Tissierellaceae bacterium]